MASSLRIASTGLITDVDDAGWRPCRVNLTAMARAVPDDEYITKDFERVVALRARTEAIARHLSDFLRSTDRLAKTGPGPRGSGTRRRDAPRP